jgi:hypothetical protein
MITKYQWNGHLLRNGLTIWGEKMNKEDFFPESSWMGNAKDLIKKPTVLAALGISAPLLIFSPVFVIFSPFWQSIIWGMLIKHFLEIQKQKKIKAVLNSFSGKYTEDDLLNLYKNDRKEFNRLYKLASDEFFRKYIKEQADHKKAQEIIKILQTRIEEMKQRLRFMEEKGKKYREDIEKLKEDINLYETILSGWKQEAQQYG